MYLEIIPRQLSTSIYISKIRLSSRSLESETYKDLSVLKEVNTIVTYVMKKDIENEYHLVLKYKKSDYLRPI